MKKISQKFFDQFLKYFSLGLLFIAAVVVIFFSLSASFNKVNKNLNNIYTTSVYLFPYSNDDPSSQTTFDQARIDVNGKTPSNLRKLTSSEQDQAVKDILACYSRRLSVLGYQEPRVTQETCSVDSVDSCFLSEKLGLVRRILINVDQPSNISVHADKNVKFENQLVQEYLNNEMNLTNQLSLETSDGVVIFSAADIRGSISAERDSASLISPTYYVNFRVKKNDLMQELARLIDNPNHSFLRTDNLRNSAFNSSNWTGANAIQPFSFDNLIAQDRQKNDPVPNGDRILILWNTKYSAVNYARRVYYLYKKYQSDQDRLNARLNSLEQKFGKFLVQGVDETNTIKVNNKDALWKGFESPKEITSNLIGYFCFKSTTAVGSSTVDLTAYAPLFSRYIVTFFRAQTGKQGVQSGIQWSNTSDFTSFLGRSSNSKSNAGIARIRIEKMYLYPEKIELDNPSAELTNLNTITANREAENFNTAFPKNILILRADFSSDETQTQLKVNDKVLQKNILFSAKTSTGSLSNNQKAIKPLSLPSWSVFVGIGIALFFLVGFMTFFYRIIGLMSWFSMCLGIVLTYFFFFKFSGFLTLAALFGLLLVALLNIFGWTHLFELFRRRLKELTPVVTGFNQAVKKSFVTTIDMHLMVAFFVVPLLFFSKYVVQSFSIIVTTGLLFSFVSYLFGLLMIKLFLSGHVWQKSRWLISGKYKLDSSGLTDGTMGSKKENLFESSNPKRKDWWAKKYWIVLPPLFTLLILSSLGLGFGVHYVVPDFAVNILIRNWFIAWSIGFTLSLVYCWLRYKWTGMLTFLAVTILFIFIFYGFSQLVLLSTHHWGMNDVILLTIIYLLSLLLFVSLINLHQDYFQEKLFLSSEDFRLRLNRSIVAEFRSKLLLIILILITFNPFLLPNIFVQYFYHREITTEILLLNLLTVIACALNILIVPYIYAGLIYCRNVCLQKKMKKNKIHHAAHGHGINYDSCDEQIIVGINKRK